MERLIKRRLAEDEELISQLASYGNGPAIFYGKAASDTDSWQNYPYIVLMADKFSDAQHGIAGMLTVDIICSSMAPQPADIEPLVRKLLEGVFFRGEEIFLLQWSKSDLFQEQNAERTALVVGMTMTFEIRELPNGETSTPDPIKALNAWAACWNKNLAVIGLSDFDEIFVPSREHPALWISQKKLSMSRQQMGVTVFVTAGINFHVFAPGVQIRREWLIELYHSLVFVKAIELDDRSPLRLQTCDFDFGADEIQGQLKTSWEFGIFRRINYEHPLEKLDVEHAGGELRDYGRYLKR